MSSELTVECPECGTTEDVYLGPTLIIGVKARISVEEIDCSFCEYNGPPEDD